MLNEAWRGLDDRFVEKEVEQVHMEDAAVVEPPQTDVVAHDDLAEGVARQRKGRSSDSRFSAVGIA